MTTTFPAPSVEKAKLVASASDATTTEFETRGQVSQL